MTTLEILAEASAAFAEAAADSTRLLSTIAGHLNAAVGDFCGIRALDPDTGEPSPLAVIHRNADAHAKLGAVFASAPLWGETGAMTRVAGVATSPIASMLTGADLLEMTAPEQRHLVEEVQLVHGLIVVALRARGRIVGVLFVARDSTPLPYSPQEIRLVECLAGPAAMALELSHASKREAAARRRASALAEAARRMQTLNADEALTTLAGLGAELLGDTGVITLLDDGRLSTKVAVHAAPGAGSVLQSAAGETTSLNESLLATAIAQDCSVRSGPLGCTAPPGSGPEHESAAAIPSVLVCPLRVRGQAIGTLSVFREAGSPYSHEDELLLQDLADYAGLVVHQAELHAHAEAARREAERERATLRSLFHEAPACIAIVRKGDHRYELSNRMNNATAGVADLTGRTLQEALPELDSQGVTALVDSVIATAQPISFTEQPAVVTVDGRPKQMFFNGVFQPVRGPDGSVEAVANFAFEVTDQVLAKRSAEYAEEKTKLLAESIPAIVWRADSLGRTDHYNNRWYEYTGLPAGSLEEDSWSAVCHPDDLPVIAARWEESTKTGSVFEGECRLRRGDGTYRWHLARSVPHKDVEGRVLGWFGASVDVEEVKRAAEERSTLLLQAEAATAEAKAQREWVNSILMQAPVAIALYRGPHYVIDLVNPLMCQIWARRSEQVVGRPYAEVFPEVAAQGVVGLAFDSVFRTGQPFFASEMAIRFDDSGRGVLGEERSFSFVHVPLRGSDGSTEGIVAVASEVTEQVLARRRVENLAQDLRASEEQFRALVENLPDLAWSAAADGHIDFYNQRWYEYTGTSFEEMEGWGWEKVQHPSVLPEVVNRWKHSLRSGEPFEMEFPLRGADGSFRTFLTRVRPLRGPDGRIIRWFGTNTDIEERQRMASDLRRALQLRDEFLSIAGHELRTPLAALLMHIQSVQRTANHSTVPARVLERLGKAESAGIRLEKLINQLLDVSRIQAGRLRLEPKSIDLVQLVSEVVQYHSRQAASGEGRITLDAPATLVGTWDEDRLDQVVTNLLTNAVKYGRGAPIEVCVSQRDSHAIIRVTDHGIGIPLEQQDSLFQRFERAAASTDYGGIGLGLWITRQIVEASGGRVELESEPGQGATFTVILPIHWGEGDEPARE